MNETERLLRAALFALNQIPNTGLKHPEFRNTYALASAIDKCLKDKEPGKT